MPSLLSLLPLLFSFLHYTTTVCLATSARFPHCVCSLCCAPFGPSLPFLGQFCCRPHWGWP
ncbi:hypothetical protein GQ53DRAFT_740161 [Thozetella sp. PMI_491]|nr:hypothetical protein GQ53DRAFT_740161 [Thozetella sp. PMI_491]